MAIMTEIRRKLPLHSRRAPDAIADLGTDTVYQISVEDIIPNRAQPRTAFNQNAIARLSDSIRRYGILQPLTVRKVMLPLSSPAPGTCPPVMYELIAGERRLRAAKLAELTHVPCIIINTDDATSAELAIIENLLRENLNMFEQAEAFSRLIHEFHLTQEEAARRVSMSQSAVANKLRILRLTPEEREQILSAGLSERHARALLKISEPSLRADVLRHIIDRRLNVSATEAYIEEIACEIARHQYKQQLLEQKQAPAAPKCHNSAAESQFPSEIRQVMSRKPTRFKGAIKDMQLFYNSVRHAVGILESTGIRGQVDKTEQEDCVVVTITLSRPDVT
jgi:ParB family chromosome partitioning protein